MPRLKKPFPNGKFDLKRGIDFIGVTCVFVCHDGQGRFLLAKRSQHCRDEQGHWDTGGGSHEFGTLLEDTVKREIKEEYGATAFNLKFIKVYEAHRYLADKTPTHWVAVVYAAQVDPEDVKNNEPSKIDDIGWFTFNKLPKPLHSQIKHSLISVHQAGII
jgi:ADP-ribose pyrophosphatase YjhB (NUDIX family)